MGLKTTVWLTSWCQSITANCHGCFSLQYFAHLACLSVLTRQVKCHPRCLPDFCHLIFYTPPPSLWSAVPCIDHSFKRSAFVVGGRRDVTHRSSWRLKVNWPDSRSVSGPGGEKNHSRAFGNKNFALRQTGHCSYCYFWALSTCRSAQNYWK